MAADRLAGEVLSVAEALRRLGYSRAAAVLEALASRLPESWDALERVDVEAMAARVAAERRTVMDQLGWREEGLPEWLRGVVEGNVEAALSALGGDAAPLLEGARRGGLALWRLSDMLLRGDEGGLEEVASKLRVSVDLVAAAALWGLQPILWILRFRAMPRISVEEWMAPGCPVCGSFTRLAVVGADTLHRLLCEACWAEWLFPPYTCPICSAEPPDVRWRELPGKPWLKLFQCRRCGNYWKLVDEVEARMRGVELPPRGAYDYLTLPLEASAREELSEGGDEPSSGGDGED